MGIHGIVAYTSTVLRPNVCEKKFSSSCRVLKTDERKRKLVPFFCLTVYESVLVAYWLAAFVA